MLQGDDPGINFIGEDEPLERGCSGDPFEEEDLYEAMGPSISEVAKARHDAAQQAGTGSPLGVGSLRCLFEAGRISAWLQLPCAGGVGPPEPCMSCARKSSVRRMGWKDLRV